MKYGPSKESVREGLTNAWNATLNTRVGSFVARAASNRTVRVATLVTGAVLTAPFSLPAMASTGIVAGALALTGEGGVAATRYLAVPENRDSLVASAKEKFEAGKAKISSLKRKREETEEQKPQEEKALPQDIQTAAPIEKLATILEEGEILDQGDEARPAKRQRTDAQVEVPAVEVEVPAAGDAAPAAAEEAPAAPAATVVIDAMDIDEPQPKVEVRSPVRNDEDSVSESVGGTQYVRRSNRLAKK